MHARAIPWRSAPTLAAVRHSTRRSAASRRCTPTRTSATTAPSWTPSSPGEWRRRRGSEGRALRLPAASPEYRERVVSLDAAERRLDRDLRALRRFASQALRPIACGILVRGAHEQVLPAPHRLDAGALERVSEPLGVPV